MMIQGLGGNAMVKTEPTGGRTSLCSCENRVTWDESYLLHVIIAHFEVWSPEMGGKCKTHTGFPRYSTKYIKQCE